MKRYLVVKHKQDGYHEVFDATKDKIDPILYVILASYHTFHEAFLYAERLNHPHATGGPR